MKLASTSLVCRWCGSPKLTLHGKSDLSFQRYRCGACLRTFSDSPRPWHTSGNTIKPEKETLVLGLLKEGLSIRQVVARTGLSRNTVMVRSRQVTVLCGCGKTARHKGWCSFRDASGLYPARAAYLERRAKTPRLKVTKAPLPEFYPYLASATADHDLLLRVNELVPRSLPEQMRADICQECILAVLEGRASLEELRSGSVRGFMRSYYARYHERFGTLSLDAPRRDGDDRPLVEQIADLRDAWCGNGAPLVFRNRHGRVIDTADPDAFEADEEQAEEPRPRDPRPRYFFRPRLAGNARAGKGRQRWSAALKTYRYHGFRGEGA